MRLATFFVVLMLATLAGAAQVVLHDDALAAARGARVANLRADAAWLAVPRVPGTPAHRAVGDRLFAELQAIPGLTAWRDEWDAATPGGPVRMANVGACVGRGGRLTSLSGLTAMQVHTRLPGGGRAPRRRGGALRLDGGAG